MCLPLPGLDANRTGPARLPLPAWTLAPACYRFRGRGRSPGSSNPLDRHLLDPRGAPVVCLAQRESNPTLVLGQHQLQRIRRIHRQRGRLRPGIGVGSDRTWLAFSVGSPRRLERVLGPGVFAFEALGNRQHAHVLQHQRGDLRLLVLGVLRRRLRNTPMMSTWSPGATMPPEPTTSEKPTDTARMPSGTMNASPDSARCKNSLVDSTGSSVVIAARATLPTTSSAEWVAIGSAISTGTFCKRSISGVDNRARWNRHRRDDGPAPSPRCSRSGWPGRRSARPYMT